jgi:4-amino-4-deoxy-L-arabinose transferase-like glycosyltransferase
MSGVPETLVSEPVRRRPVRRYLVLAVTTVSGSLLVGLWRHSPVSVLLVGVSTAGCVVAVSVAPRTSNDLWSYTIYGRMVSVHGESPYDKLPVDFRSDPFFARVSPRWQHRGSVYGPVFVGFAAAGTALAGDSPLATRLFFQLSAAAAAIAVLWLIWRRTRSPAALAWLGLHPLLGPVIVNGGHNDIAIGLAVLVATLLVRRRRGWAAGALLGVAALIKLTTLLALVGIVLWGWRRRERRVASDATIAATVVVVLGYLPFLGGASRVLTGADKTLTPASLFNPLGAALLGHDAWRDVPNPLTPNDTLIAIFYVSLAAVAVLALATGWRAARARGPEAAIGATTGAYTVGAEYSFPWYAAWALPVLADERPTPLAWVVWAQAAVMLAALKLPILPSTTVLDTTLRGTITYAAPILLAVAFLVAGVRSTRHGWSDQDAPGLPVGATGAAAPRR